MSDLLTRAELKSVFVQLHYIVSERTPGGTVIRRSLSEAELDLLVDEFHRAAKRHAAVRGGYQLPGMFESRATLYVVIMAVVMLAAGYLWAASYF